MPIFEALDAPHHWRPSPLAAGPFAGLQGGAVASLLTAEVEAKLADDPETLGTFRAGMASAVIGAIRSTWSP